ncbi:MAG: DinB family protein [Planctomycetia bacterium]|nr:DinB family protein [Planctomycetia bacterium]
MTSVALIQRLHQHRRWVNENLLATAKSLSNEQLHRSFQIGQGSIWKSLLHLYAGEFVWLEALWGDENPLTPGDMPGRLPGNQEGEGAIASLPELAQKWAKLDERWALYLADLSEKSLDEVVYKVSTSSGFGRRLGTRRADVLLHVCTHAQYTTAQIVNMLRHAGIEKLPDTMLITLARQEADVESRTT